METGTVTSKERLAEVRQLIIDTLLEIDNINLQINPHLQATYAKTIGYLENDLYKWQLKARRTKRKFTLAQAAANRSDAIQLEAIEVTLDEEFAAWEEQLSNRMAEQLKLLETFSAARPLSPSEERELKALHKKLIKRLHPDLHPSQPEEAYRFFLIAQTAYESGDVATLRAIDLSTEDYETANAEPDLTSLNEDDLELELTMAEAQLTIIQEQLEHLKTSFPYTLTEILDNPARLTKRKHELEAEIKAQKEVVTSYEVKLTELLGSQQC